MQRFFQTREALEWFLKHLHELICPFCGALGTFVRHGFIRGAVSPDKYGIRAWRIFCDPDSPRGPGCGRAPSLRLSNTLRQRCYSTHALWAFIQGLRQGLSVRAAWRVCRISLSMRTGYRLYKRLVLCQSVLRTHLYGRAPPTKAKKAGLPLFEVFEHLEETFGQKDAVLSYQETLQQDFLATA